MSDPSIHFEILDHTADIGILVRAKTLEGLFDGAAQAMMQILCPHCQITARENHLLHLFGEDRQELMVNWLSELNFLLQTRQFLTARVEISLLTDQEMRVQVSGERVNPMSHVIRTEIKAVTYHRIQVHQEADGGWRSQIYFDV